MATALFINRTDLVKNSIIDGNVDTNKFIQFVKIAQEIHIRNYTGSKLYDKLQSDILGSGLSGAYQTLVNTYIAPMLIHFALVEYLPYAGVNITNNGIFSMQPENSTVLDKNRVDSLIEKARDTAQHYTRRFIDFVTFNQTLFPEYNSNSNGDMNPDDVADFGGFVL